MAAGLTVVHLAVVSDPAEALRSLNRLRYGSGVRSNVTSGMCLERCWDDWDTVPMDPGPRAGAMAGGIRFRGGRIMVPLISGLTLAEYRSEFRAAVRHLRLHEVCISPRYLDGRAGMVADVVRQPRYTPGDDGVAGYREARLCDDLYVVDPTDPAGAWRLFWLAVSARLAASEPGRPLWR